MALAAITRVVQDDEGNAVSGATVEIRREISGAPLVSLFSDRDGLNSIVNPYTAPTAQFTVFSSPGTYRIDITVGSETVTERYVVALEDVPGEESIEITEVTSGSTYQMLESDRIIYINKTVPGPITVTLVTAVGRTDDVQIVDGRGDAATNPITIVGAGSPGEPIIGRTDGVVINMNRGSLKLNPHQDGKWFI